MTALLLTSIAVPVVGVGVVLGFEVLARKASRSQLIGYLVAVGVGAVIVTPLIMYNFADFFPGPGLCASFLLLFVAFFSFLFLAARRQRVKEALGGDREQYRLYLVGLFLVPALLIAPIVGAFGLTGACNAANRVLVSDIVEAAQAYKQDQGEYPDTLEALVPGYLPEIPAPRCLAPYGWLSMFDRTGETFEIVRCRDEDATLILAPLVGDGSFRGRYNLETGVWTPKVSFLDGWCSYLR
ncbi:MAG TPA: hypothetical protein ENI95_13810 [Chloroflexi bacterium]|nr:hypothetical protein [Chloroflexota bacterium]